MKKLLLKLICTGPFVLLLGWAMVFISHYNGSELTSVFLFFMIPISVSWTGMVIVLFLLLSLYRNLENNPKT